jgi:hypothetical protein
MKNRRMIVDCGCGDGDLVRELRAKDITAMGVDHRYELLNESIPADLFNAILPICIEDSALIKDKQCVLIVCRPCHSGFPANINEFRADDVPFYYIGFEKNLEDDLHGAPCTLIKENVGEENEHIWEVKSCRFVL